MLFCNCLSYLFNAVSKTLLDTQLITTGLQFFELQRLLFFGMGIMTPHFQFFGLEDVQKEQLTMCLGLVRVLTKVGKGR